MTNPDLLALANELDDIETDAAGKCNWSEVATVSDALRRLASSEDAVKVRELEWVEMPDRDPESASWIAETDLGRSYRVFAAWWGAQNKYGYVFDGFYHTENEAKAAAQADYETRILSALEAPAAGDGEPAFPTWGAEDEAYELGKRDGYESAIQDLDLATGGDGEFKGSTIPGCTVDVPAMKARIVGRTNTAPPADAGMRDEVGWLIEKDDPPVYHLLSADYDEQWTGDAGRAVRFARKEDAQAYVDHVGWTMPPIRVVEHMWPALTAPGATTESDGGAKAGSSPILASKEEQRTRAHGMTPVGTIADASGCTEVGPSDPSPTRSDVTALTDIAKERQRQREVKGWSLAHDDAHVSAELAMAGACYALASALNTEHALNTTFTRYWPWGRKWWKPKTPRENLVRAGALIVAEIERIDRLETHEIRRK